MISLAVGIPTRIDKVRGGDEAGQNTESTRGKSGRARCAELTKEGEIKQQRLIERATEERDEEKGQERPPQDSDERKRSRQLSEGEKT